MPDYSRKEEPCFFRASVIVPPQPPESCKPKRLAYETKDGDCVPLTAEPGYLHWIDVTHALDLRNADRPLLLSFPRQPESLNPIWGIRAGIFQYVNEFGVKLEVPRFKVIDVRSPISSRLVSPDSTTRRDGEQPRTSE